MSRPYAFNKSLRFRFGAVFGSLFFISLLLVAFFLYLYVRRQFETGFQQNLASGAALVLSKTEINPLTVPLPQNGEQFVLLYDNGQTIDTLFPRNRVSQRKSPLSTTQVRTVTSRRNLETGGQLVIEYSRPAGQLERSISQLQSILFFYLPVAFLLALLAGFSLSGFLLKPIGKLIDQANQNALAREIRLLPVPDVEDELHALVRSLNNMLSQLQESRRLQNAFFASAAHELRTPLSIMLTGLQVSRPGITDEATLALIDREVREVQRLSALVDNLLLMSRLASSQKDGAHLRNVETDLAETLMEQVGLLSAKAMAAHQIFKIELLPTEGNFLVVFDPEHLSILTRNLLDNAIIHGAKDASIEIRLFNSPDQVTRLVIANQTDQMGMDLTRLSKEFEKGDHFREGFGLGLWIIKELARINGATVGFDFKAPLFTATLLFITGESDLLRQPSFASNSTSGQ